MKTLSLLAVKPLIVTPAVKLNYRAICKRDFVAIIKIKSTQSKTHHSDNLKKKDCSLNHQSLCFVNHLPHLISLHLSYSLWRPVWVVIFFFSFFFSNSYKTAIKQCALQLRNFIPTFLNNRDIQRKTCLARLIKCSHQLMIICCLYFV